MSSANRRSVAADSNVLLSAIAGKGARRVFENAELVVVTTEHNISEVMEYIPEFAERYGLPSEVLLEVLGLLPIVVYEEPQYAPQLTVAGKLLSARDPDDVALAALALHLNVPIWSNDRDYENFPTGVFTTAALLRLLGK